jgi:hypothetical protein
MDLTPEGLTRAAQRRGVPGYCIGGLVRYVTDGVPPGDFLMAVLGGDLFEALGRAWPGLSFCIVMSDLPFLGPDCPDASSTIGGICGCQPDRRA